MMNYKTLLLILGLSFFSACQNEEVNLPAPAVCTIVNPLEEIEWLKPIHENFQRSMAPFTNEIIQYEYKGECVFWVDYCYQCPDGLVVVYNANKEIICEFGSIAGLNTCPDFEDLATNKQILWGNI